MECSHVLLEHKIALPPCLPCKDVLCFGKLADELSLLAEDLEIVTPSLFASIAPLRRFVETDKALVGAGFAKHPPATHLDLSFCKNRWIP